MVKTVKKRGSRTRKRASMGRVKRVKRIKVVRHRKVYKRPVRKTRVSNRTLLLRLLKEVQTQNKRISKLETENKRLRRKLSKPPVEKVKIAMGLLENGKPKVRLTTITRSDFEEGLKTGELVKQIGFYKGRQLYNAPELIEFEERGEETEEQEAETVSPLPAVYRLSFSATVLNNHNSRDYREATNFVIYLKEKPTADDIKKLLDMHTDAPARFVTPNTQSYVTPDEVNIEELTEAPSGENVYNDLGDWELSEFLNINTTEDRDAIRHWDESRGLTETETALQRGLSNIFGDIETETRVKRKYVR